MKKRIIMQFEVIKFSNKIDEITPDLLDYQTIMSGLKASEGPVWLKSERSFLFTDFPNLKIFKWNEKEGISIFKEDSGRAVGLTLDNDENIIACESITRKITRLSKKGESLDVATNYMGKKLNSPNDVVVKSNGDIYFTDPYSTMINNEREIDFNGVFKVDSKTGEVTLFSDNFYHPNGLAFSLDEKTLYINDSKKNHIRAFMLDSMGLPVSEKVFAELDSSYGKGSVDGMKVDSMGNVYVTGPGGIWIFDPRGKALGIIKIPDIALNFTFGGNEMKDLFITGLSTVYKTTLNISGI
jgi:gluconolactonase